MCFMFCHKSFRKVCFELADFFWIELFFYFFFLFVWILLTFFLEVLLIHPEYSLREKYLTYSFIYQTEFVCFCKLCIFTAVLYHTGNDFCYDEEQHNLSPVVEASEVTLSQYPTHVSLFLLFRKAFPLCLPRFH